MTKILREDGRMALGGMVIGLLLWNAATTLSLDIFPGVRLLQRPTGPVVVGAFCALLAVTRWRPLLWVPGAVLGTGILLVTSTPMMSYLVTRAEVDESPQKADAIYVCGGGILSDGTLNSVDQQRHLHAFSLLKRGLADELVVCRLANPAPAHLYTIREQMRLLDLDYPTVELRPARNTRDEALALGELARERGWRLVYLVTSPSHMSRALATFRKAGVPAVASACRETRYNPARLASPAARLVAFSDWLREAIGYRVYAHRGWL